MEKEKEELVRELFESLPEMKKVLIYNTLSASFIAAILFCIAEVLFRIV